PIRGVSKSKASSKKGRHIVGCGSTWGRPAAKDPAGSLLKSMGKANVTARAKGSLSALNFFMADMQSGIGPFVGVFLLAHGWLNGSIGSVMTIGAIAGVLVTAPAGAWVDSSGNKRWIVVVSGLAAVIASSIILVAQSFWPVALSQVAT